MASYFSSLKPPEPVDFATPNTWPPWITRFERYRVASGLDKKEELIQVSTLIYAMGQDAEDIWGSFTISEDEKRMYKSAKQSFQNHFVRRKNPIYKRARYIKRKQQTA